MPLLLVAAWLIAGCGPREARDERPAVAHVGETVITTDEFALSYELGFAHLKRGDAPRRAYLSRMIDERLLALEGYRLGLDEAPAVRRQIESKRAELLVEQVFEREVNDRVVVTDAEIQEAIQKDVVRFKVRYVPARTHEEAARLAAAWREEGFEAIVDRLVQAEPERRWQSGDFESPYVSWRDIDPALLEAIEQLPAGEVSQPVPYRGSYLVLQVADIRREAAPPITDPAVRERYEHVLFLRKAKEAARRFIGREMRPLDVRIKAGTFQRLRRHLWDWYSQRPPAANLLEALSGAAGPSADSLRALLPEVVVTTSQGEWTVEALLGTYPVNRYPLSTRNRELFNADLYDAIGLLLRDRHFVRMAEAEGLDRAPVVQAELKRWSDKWVYRQMLAAIADTMEVTGADLATFYRHHTERYRIDASGRAAPLDSVAARVEADLRRERLRGYVADLLETLRDRYPVAIHHDVLDTLDVTDPSGAVEPDVVILKGHTRRPAFPVVDPRW